VTGATVSHRVRPGLRRTLIVAVVLLVPIAVHAIWDQVESTLLAREISKIAQRHEPVDVVSRQSPLATSEQRQSARLYAAAADLARWQIQSDGHDIARKDVEAPTADPRFDAATLNAYLAESEPALQLLNLATPLDFQGFSSIAPSLHTNQSSLQTLSAMNCLTADILSARGEGDVAAGVLVRSIRLQRTITIPFYRSISNARLYGSLRILLKHAPPGEDALLRLQRGFEEWPDDDGLVLNVQTQRAELLGEFWPYPSNGASWALRPRQAYRRDAGASVVFVVLRPLITHGLRRELTVFEDALTVARGPWPAKYDSARALARRYDVDPQRSSRPFPGWTAGWIWPSLAAWRLDVDLPIAGVNLAYRRTAIAVLAVERFRRAHAGALPASLDALVPDYLSSVPQDPFDGKPLKYRPSADGYVVYSVDVNRADDGGVLYGFGSGSKMRPVRRDDPAPRDIGIRVTKERL
jgi:hypothetical protein